jgi:hypothetical protein
VPPKKPAPPKPFVKASNAEIEARVSTVFSLIVAGCTTAEIVRYSAEKTTWGVGRRQIEDYIAAATAQFIELSRATRSVELGKALSRLNDLYAKSLRIQDYKACLAMQKEISTLLALHAPAQTAGSLDDDGDGPPTRVLFQRARRTNA